MPSSSPRCATFPRASDKVKFYSEINRLLKTICDSNKEEKADEEENEGETSAKKAKISPYFTDSP